MSIFCWPLSVDIFNILPGFLWQPLLIQAENILLSAEACRSVSLEWFSWVKNPVLSLSYHCHISMTTVHGLTVNETIITFVCCSQDCSDKAKKKRIKKTKKTIIENQIAIKACGRLFWSTTKSAWTAVLLNWALFMRQLLSNWLSKLFSAIGVTRRK